MKYEVHIEKRSPGSWIGDEYIERLAADGWVLQAWGEARDFGANEPAAGMRRYVFFRPL